MVLCVHEGIAAAEARDYPTCPRNANMKQTHPAPGEGVAGQGGIFRPLLQDRTSSCPGQRLTRCGRCCSALTHGQSVALALIPRTTTAFHSARIPGAPSAAPDDVLLPCPSAPVPSTWGAEEYETTDSCRMLSSAEPDSLASSSARGTILNTAQTPSTSA